jgi:ATP/maltotriose-dependent transcriptional regulator MalT
MVVLELALHLPDAARPQAEQFALDGQTLKTLTPDWRKARLARLLAQVQARLGNFEAATALAHTVPDTEERAFAQQEITAALCRAGLVEPARQLAGKIEDSRRYGTYRQKSGALAEVARTLHRRGNPEEATTLLAQAELLIPKKPGWSDGVAIVVLAEAFHACGQGAKAHDLLARAEGLAQTIAGSWKGAELARVATGWRACDDPARANAALEAATQFLASLTPWARAEEAAPFARAVAQGGDTAPARGALLQALQDAQQAENRDTWRKPHVRALLAWAELFGDAPPAKE